MKQTQIVRAIAVAAAIGALAAPAVASTIVPSETTLKGTITAFNGKYDLHVRDHHGKIEDVQLHRGTIINPTGLTLRPGMTVTILGNENNGSLAANEVDTPYHYSPYSPAFAYLGQRFAGPWIGAYGSYPLYGYGGYGYGPGYGYGLYEPAPVYIQPAPPPDNDGHGAQLRRAL
ncbi:MAG: hypothetical protein ACREM8_15405 [Vulcanimicrobiaceae bacterium]